MSLGALLAGAPTAWRTCVSGRALLELGQPWAVVRAFTRRWGPSCCPTSRRGTRAPPPLLPGEPLRAGPARAEECQSGLSTRVASGERPAAALASPWQKRWAATTSARPTSAGIVLSINQRNGIDLNTLSAVALPPDNLPSGQPRSNGQPPPRAGGHAPPRARLHAPHARCGF